MNMRTKEDRKKEFKLIQEYFNERGYILLTDHYENLKQRIEYICPKHKDKGVQSATWNQLKSKRTGCKQCAQEYIGKCRRKPESEYIQLCESRKLIYDHMEYKNGKGYICYYCPSHVDKGIEKALPASFRTSKVICPWCNHAKRDKESLQEELNALYDNIVVIGEYEKASKKMEFLCTRHNKLFSATPNNILRGESCPLCGKELNSARRTKTTYDFIQEVSSIFGDEITVISEYKGSRNKVTCRCNIHKIEFTSNSSRLVRGSTSPCPICQAENTRKRCVKSNEQFLRELADANPNIVALEEYKDDHSKILCRCKIHNYEWFAMPNKILHKYTGCPRCCAYHNENVIAKILDKWGYDYFLQKRFIDCNDKNALPFDVYLPSFNICIEYDGEQHFYPLRRGKMSQEDAEKSFQATLRHDKIKNKYCKKNGIYLIRIPYFEKENIEYILFDEFVKCGAIELVS